MRSFPLISASCRHRGGDPLALYSQAAGGGSLSDLRFKGGASLAMSFGLEWDTGSIHWTIRELPELAKTVVEKFVVSMPDGTRCEFVWKAELGSTLYTTNGSAADLTDLKFSGLVPRLNGEHPAAKDRLIGFAATQLRTFSEAVTWLRGTRQAPPRWFNIGTPTLQIKSDGGGASELLAQSAAQNTDLLRRVSSWFEQMCGMRLQALEGSVENSRLFSLVLSPLAGSSSRNINMRDTGEGMQQVLPVVTIGAIALDKELAPPGSIVSIEHPELHLHPAGHASIAMLFAEVARQRDDLVVVLETHSENLLLQCQLEIAEGRLPADRLIVYWLDDSGEQIDLSKIAFDANARPVGRRLPPGAFAETTALSRSILQARKSARAHSE